MEVVDTGAERRESPRLRLVMSLFRIGSANAGLMLSSAVREEGRGRQGKVRQGQGRVRQGSRCAGQEADVQEGCAASSVSPTQIVKLSISLIHLASVDRDDDDDDEDSD